MSIDNNWLEQKLFNRALTGEETVVLTSRIETSRVASGEKIVSQGQPGGVLYLLRSGSAAVRREGVNPIDVATVGEGAVLGEMSFLADEPASASVVALSDCVVYRISRAAFSELMANYQSLAFALFVYILRHTATVIRHMNEEHISMHQYIAGGRMGV